MFGLGPMEMVIIGVLAVLLFGNRLPDVAKKAGQAITDFKKGINGIDDEVQNATRNAGSSSSSSSRVQRNIEDREEASAPKFEPPPAEGAA